MARVKDEHHWKGEEPRPDIYFGFCYLIVCKSTSRKYIGKKQYYAANGRYKRRITNRLDKGWKDYHWRESDWRFYTGSSKELNRDIKALGKSNFDFIILTQHITKGELHYAEIDHQITQDVLRSKLPNGVKEFYNKAISGVRFIPPEYHTEETREKIRNRWSGGNHPMFGKTHPNKGKKLPQTAPKNHASKTKVMATNGIENSWLPKDKPLPEGWRRGWTHFNERAPISDKGREAARKRAEASSKKARERYYNSPNYCKNCGEVIPFDKKSSWRNCSEKCRSEWRSKCTKAYNERKREEKKDDKDN